MRVTICWSHISGYMAACCRALASRDGVDLSIVAFKSDAPGSEISFGEDLLRGLNYRLLDGKEQRNAKLVHSIVVEQKPDVVVFAGWFHKPYTSLVKVPELANAKFIMTMDTPRRDTLRQRLGRYAIGGLLEKLSGVIVAGERAFQLARYLGVPERKIRRGVYGFDAAPLADLYNRRRAGIWPRRFLFVARYVPDKAIDVLAEGYRRYRATARDPWPLTCCGKGPLAHLLKGDGIEDRGFVQPDALPQLLVEHGALVLSSRYEPWGVAIAEALSSGLPVVCTEACGASVELVRSHYNGLTVATDDPDALAAGLRWAHDNYDRLPSLGHNGRSIADAFAAPVWAERWHSFFREITSPG